LTTETIARMVLLCIVAAAALGARRPARATDLSALDAIVEKGIADQRYPGAVLLVKQRGKTLYARAFGRHTYDPTSPPTRMDTIFDLASCSKVVGGTPAALLMVEDGKLRLDEPVAAHWPEFASNGKQDVTLRDLLTHVSGLKAYESFGVVEKARRPEESHVRALYRHYAALPPAYPPRSKVLYSCLNLQSAAALVQSVAGEPLEEMLRRRVWNPLGMKDTTYRPSGRRLTRCAPIATGPDGRPVRGKVHDPLAAYHGSDTLCPGNAGLFSTAGDLARYAEMILGDGERRRRRVLRPESVRLMTSVQTPPGVTTLRSVGWGVYDRPPFAGPGTVDEKRRTIGHTGYTGTWMWLDPGSGALIILLTNRVLPSPATNGGEGRSIDAIRAAIARVVVARLAAPRAAHGTRARVMSNPAARNRSY